MEYAMLSTLIPKEQAESFKKNSRHIMQDAANAFQWNIYHGLCANLNKDIALINVIPVSSFPQHYKKPFVYASKFGSCGTNVGFCNVILLRNYHKVRKIYKALLGWCASGTEEKTLFIYTISEPFIQAVRKVKNKYPHIHVCAIVADLPNMGNLSADQGIFKKAYDKHSSKKAYQLLSCVDSFVLLTKHMAEYMHIRQPYCVVEGMVSPETAALPRKAEDGIKKILYTGTLHAKFGMLHLLEAFRTIPDPNMRLIVCGIGDSEDQIRRAALEDSRIEYRGQLPREEILQLQCEATVLVNPRQNNETFTRYSFPSKTMEYLASGVPVISYKLDGIPDDYDQYLIYPEDDSVAALASAIVSVCSEDEETRKQIGLAGKNYVLNHKSNFVQTKRMLDFLESL